MSFSVRVYLGSKPHLPGQGFRTWGLATKAPTPSWTGLIKPIPSGSVDQGASLIIHHGSFDLRKKILMALPLGTPVMTCSDWVSLQISVISSSSAGPWLSRLLTDAFPHIAKLNSLFAEKIPQPLSPCGFSSILRSKDNHTFDPPTEQYAAHLLSFLTD